MEILSLNNQKPVRKLLIKATRLTEGDIIKLRSQLKRKSNEKPNGELMPRKKIRTKKCSQPSISIVQIPKQALERQKSRKPFIDSTKKFPFSARMKKKSLTLSNTNHPQGQTRRRHPSFLLQKSLSNKVSTKVSKSSSYPFAKSSGEAVIEKLDTDTPCKNDLQSVTMPQTFQVSHNDDLFDSMNDQSKSKTCLKLPTISDAAARNSNTTEDIKNNYFHPCLLRQPIVLLTRINSSVGFSKSINRTTTKFEERRTLPKRKCCPRSPRKLEKKIERNFSSADKFVSEFSSNNKTISPQENNVGETHSTNVHINEIPIETEGCAANNEKRILAGETSCTFESGTTVPVIQKPVHENDLLINFDSANKEISQDCQIETHSSNLVREKVAPPISNEVTVREEFTHGTVVSPVIFEEEISPLPVELSSELPSPIIFGSSDYSTNAREDCNSIDHNQFAAKNQSPAASLSSSSFVLELSQDDRSELSKISQDTDRDSVCNASRNFSLQISQEVADSNVSDSDHSRMEFDSSNSFVLEIPDEPPVKNAVDNEKTLKPANDENRPSIMSSLSYTRESAFVKSNKTRTEKAKQVRRNNMKNARANVNHEQQSNRQLADHSLNTFTKFPNDCVSMGYSSKLKHHAVFDCENDASTNTSTMSPATESFTASQLRSQPSYTLSVSKFSCICPFREYTKQRLRAHDPAFAVADNRKCRSQKATSCCHSLAGASQFSKSVRHYDGFIDLTETDDESAPKSTEKSKSAKIRLKTPTELGCKIAFTEDVEHLLKYELPRLKCERDKLNLLKKKYFSIYEIVMTKYYCGKPINSALLELFSQHSLPPGYNLLRSVPSAEHRLESVKTTCAACVQLQGQVRQLDLSR